MSSSADPHARQPILQSGQPLDTAAGAVICLHGRGASAADILQLADKFQLAGLAYLAPEAAGHTWYPYSFLSPIERNQPGLDSALRLVGEILRRVASSGIPLHKIALAGFSQGACLASEYLARHPARYGGLLALTGGLIGPPGSPWNYAGDLAGTPVFFGAGDPDPHVPWSRVEESASVLAKLGGEVVLRRYPGLPHSVNQDEMEHGKRILERLLEK